MELELFTDLIDALVKVAGGLKAIVNLPKAEREAMRRILDETFAMAGRFGLATASVFLMVASLWR